MKRILLVDDEPHVIRILKLSLIKAGYEIVEASNGLQALENIKHVQPDILITDIDMPRMNGKELCLQIEKTLPEREFMIFVLTSRADSEHRIWTSSIDNLEFLEKPVSIRKLIARLDAHFSDLSQSEDEACLTAQSTQ
jgi:DNA-binding response OmpR family regulator